MEELTRQEAYAESEEIYSEIRKEVVKFLNEINPKIKILKDFADKHKLIVVNPLEIDGDMEGAQHYVGKNFSTLSDEDKNIGPVDWGEYLDKGYDGCWISSSDLC